VTSSRHPLCCVCYAFTRCGARLYACLHARWRAGRCVGTGMPCTRGEPYTAHPLPRLQHRTALSTACGFVLYLYLCCGRDSYRIGALTASVRRVADALRGRDETDENGVNAARALLRLPPAAIYPIRYGLTTHSTRGLPSLYWFLSWAFDVAFPCLLPAAEHYRPRVAVVFAGRVLWFAWFFYILLFCGISAWAVARTCWHCLPCPKHRRVPRTYAAAGRGCFSSML